MWGVWAIIVFVGALAGHAALCRLPVSGNNVAKFLGVGGLAGILLSTYLISVYGLALTTWAGLFLYMFLCELYIFSFTLVHSSVSASLLIALRAGALTDQEIHMRYSDERMVDLRIGKLLANGFLREGDSGYTLTDRGRLLLAIFRRLRGFFRHSAREAADDRLLARD